VDDLFGPPISVYTRSQAIADGVLRGRFQTQPGRPGFTIPGSRHRHPDGMSISTWSRTPCRRDRVRPGRLWDVLSLAAVAARRGADSDRVTFRVIFEMPDDRRETVKAIMTDRRRRPEWRTGDHDHATGRTIEMQVSITFEVDNAVFED